MNDYSMIPKIIIDELADKHLLYGDHCKGCKYYFRTINEYPCRMCELISKPSHYVKAKLRGEA